MGLEAKWILNYPDIPDKWLVKMGTNLTQLEITSLELGGFVLQDGALLKNLIPATDVEVEVVDNPFTIKSDISDDPTDEMFSLPDMKLKFSLGHSGTPMASFPDYMHSTSDGDKYPTLWDGRPFQFVLRPLLDHLKKMEDHRSIKCIMKCIIGASRSIMKYIKFLAQAIELYLLSALLDLLRERSCMRC